jgi:predicted RNA-binding protein with PIN domain
MVEHERTLKSRRVTRGSRVESEKPRAPESGDEARGDRRWRWFFSEALVSLAITAAFVIAGLTWATVESQLSGREETPRPRYASPIMMEREPSIWLVDGYNVIHTGLLGGRDRSQWWTEPRRLELLERAARFEPASELWIVFDGPEDPGEGATPSGLRCVFAKSADDWLVDRVRRSDDPSQIAVVTADRQVAGRAQTRGAQIVSPADFLARCTG